MDSIIDGLKPELVWKHFETLTKIPRPSKHEERILQYLRNFAKERNLETREDSTGNIDTKTRKWGWRKFTNYNYSKSCRYGMRKK